MEENLSQILYPLEIFEMKKLGVNNNVVQVKFVTTLKDLNYNMGENIQYNITKFRLMLTEQDIDNMKKNSIITKP